MKTKSIITCLLLITATFSFSSFKAAKQPSRSITVFKSTMDGFEHFHAHRQRQGVALSWGMSSMNVDHYIIQRSYDERFYDDIDMCFPDGSRWNKYNDDSVFPTTLFYRVVAVMVDGTTITSSVEAVKIQKHAK